MSVEAESEDSTISNPGGDWPGTRKDTNFDRKENKHINDSLWVWVQRLDFCGLEKWCPRDMFPVHLTLRACRIPDRGELNQYEYEGVTAKRVADSISRKPFLNWIRALSTLQMSMNLKWVHAISPIFV